MLIGSSVLGNLNKPATSAESLGLAFWRIVISSGIICIAIGFLNIVAVRPFPSQSLLLHKLTIRQSYIFCDPPQAITSRQIRSKGAVITALPTSASFSRSASRAQMSRKSSQWTISSPSQTPSLKSTYFDPPAVPTTPPPQSYAGTVFPGHYPAPASVAPSSVYSQPTQRPHSRGSSIGVGRSGVGPRLPLNISRPIVQDDAQFQKFGVCPWVQEPNAAFHPAAFEGYTEKV